jgi:hypothetical protein
MAVVLSPVARTKLSSYIADIARANNVEDARHTFAVQPVPEQKIIAAYQEVSGLLKQINVFPVDNAKGEKIGLQIGTRIAGTTDTRVKPRNPVPVGNLDLLDEYDCTQTNYDVAYYWSLLNAWKHHPNFKSMLQSMVIVAIALDKLCIGFNGLYRAASSDRVANPMLQDVKKGWLQKFVTLPLSNIMKARTMVRANWSLRSVQRMSSKPSMA